MDNKQEPYIIKQETIELTYYNPKFGDARICNCGHSYCRHFDTYNDMIPVGCKHCKCWLFEEKSEQTRCVMCHNIIEGLGWQHHEESTQDVFNDIAGDFFKEDYPDVDAAACSETCWREFMEMSYEHWITT